MPKKKRPMEPNENPSPRSPEIRPRKEPETPFLPHEEPEEIPDEEPQDPSQDEIPSTKPDEL